jgi:hypothetical protein
MPAFRKKPLVIEADQWFEPGDHPKVTRKPKGQTGFYVSRAWQEELAREGYPYGYDDIIETLEGPHIVSPGDWIIKGVRGEFYACKPDIFAMTYETAQAADPNTFTVTLRWEVISPGNQYLYVGKLYLGSAYRTGYRLFKSVVYDYGTWRDLGAFNTLDEAKYACEKAACEALGAQLS